MNTKRPIVAVCVLILLALSGCASSKKAEYDDVISVDVSNVELAEAALFQSYVRTMVNKLSEKELVGLPGANRTSKFQLQIIVDEKIETSSEARVRDNSKEGMGKPRMVSFYGYRIHVELRRAKDKTIVWAWRPDRIKTFPSKEKAIKWLSGFIAKSMRRHGYLKPQFLDEASATFLVAPAHA